MDIKGILKEFKGCACGKEHAVGIREVVVGRGAVKETGAALLRNSFRNKLLLVADGNTLRAAQGIEESIERAGFTLSRRLYENLRTADMSEVRAIEELLNENDGVIAVGTGSIHDICRLASARKNKPLCLFATAASMDGFASYNAPITENNFKITYSAKTPELIIADTEILAAAPDELKSAGFGDMAGKYVALIDWQLSNLLTGEYYCERVAGLTRTATDKIMSLSDKILSKEPSAAREVFEALLLTGIGMAFTQNSRPASGAEHILSHYWECMKLAQGRLSDFHGKKVGVATLIVMEEYERLASLERVAARRVMPDWEDIYRHYGVLADEVRALNTPDTVTAALDPQAVEGNWEKIREIVHSVPSRAEIYAAMKRAGCATTAEEIGVSKTLLKSGLKYHPYMRKRVTLMRIKDMLT